MLTDKLRHPLILRVSSVAPLVMHCSCHTTTLHFAVCLLPSLETQTDPQSSFKRSSEPLLRQCLLGPEGPAFSCEVAHLMSSAEPFPRIEVLPCLVTITYTSHMSFLCKKAAGDMSQWTQHKTSDSCQTQMLILGPAVAPSRLTQLPLC